MTARQLHDLLDDLVSGTAPVDLVDVAWDRARRVRRRRTAAAAGATAAVLVGATALAVVDRDGRDTEVPPVVTPSATGSTSPEPSPTGDEPPDTTYDGIAVWWSPTVPEEAELPWVEDSPLPRFIDLMPRSPEPAVLDSASAVFAVFDEGGGLTRALVLSPDGAMSALDVAHLDPARDESGNAAALLSADGGLAPDGRHVFFVQNSSLEVYEFATGTWRTIDTPDWVAEGARWLDAATIWVPSALGASGGSTYGVDGRALGFTEVNAKAAIGPAQGSPYGPVKVTRGAIAQTNRLVGPVVPVPEGNVSNPEAVAVRQGGTQLVLALDDPLAASGRSKGCCPVVGLLDADTVVFESSGRLLAWTVGTHDVRRVAEFIGTTDEGYAASWASLTAS